MSLGFSTGIHTQLGWRLLQVISDQKEREDKAKREEAARVDAHRRQWELHRSEREREQRALRKQREDVRTLPEFAKDIIESIQ